MNINVVNVRADIETKGYSIAKNAVSKDFVNNQKKRWITHFTGNPNTKPFVRGKLLLGEDNFCSYSNIPAWCMYRYFEFLWNKNSDPNALKIHLDIHKARNEIQGFPKNFGLEYNEDGYGIYISTSLYEVNKGMLEAHSDGHGEKPILHYMLPLTFKGADYKIGGLHLIDRNNKTVDVDSLVSPGDLIFFDGRCEHWVAKIDGHKDKDIGRLAVFAIPTFFEKDTKFGKLIRYLRIKGYEISSSLKNKFIRRKRYPGE